MTPWVLLVASLAGANLARLGRRAAIVAAILLGALLVAAAIGLLPVSSWERFAGALVAVVVGFVAWKGLALSSRPVEAATGMAVFATAALIPFVLIDVAPPTDVRPWSAIRDGPNLVAISGADLRCQALSSRWCEGPGLHS